MSNTEKNIQIKETYLATKARREHQVCSVFSVKVQENKLNAAQREALKMMFVEAKWMYNHILNLSKNENTDIFSLKYTDLKEVKHFTKDKEEVVSRLIHLSSQMKQEVLTSIFTSIRSLAKAKKKGNKVGKLKFISEYKSINLKQCGISYKIVSKNKVKIQGIKKPLKVNGIDQLKRFGDSYELANAKLLLKPSGYYIAFTVYTERDYNVKANKPRIGIDFGCQTSFTLSDGRKINALVEESERLKRLQRRITRAKKKVWLVTLKKNESVFVKEIDEVHKESMRKTQYTCPLCGGRLVLRSGTYGNFYGCSNYKTNGCRYIRNINKGMTQRTYK